MSSIEENARKKRTDNVYSSTYDNGGWSKRDSVPTKDPIGDVEEENFRGSSDPTRYIWTGEPIDVSPTWTGEPIDVSPTELNFEKFRGIPEYSPCCKNPKKYKNIISNNLKFWSCKNCGADLGDIK
jgi:hypothetical protein